MSTFLSKGKDPREGQKSSLALTDVRTSSVSTTMTSVTTVSPYSVDPEDGKGSRQRDAAQLPRLTDLL